MSNPRNSKVWAIVRVSSGNFLEMYDFMAFGYYATAIGRAFFPSGSAFGSLMLSLMTFGAGFLMRPLGALVLGAYTDRHGRRAGLLLTLGMMSIGIFSIACVPAYATIGLLAPLLVLIGRLLQGFSGSAGNRCPYADQTGFSDTGFYRAGPADNLTHQELALVWSKKP